MSETGFGEKLVALFQGKPDALGKTQSAAGLSFTGVSVGEIDRELIDDSGGEDRAFHLRSSLLTSPI
jgi:hypothetical protein